MKPLIICTWTLLLAVVTMLALPIEPLNLFPSAPEGLASSSSSHLSLDDAGNSWSSSPLQGVGSFLESDIFRKDPEPVATASSSTLVGPRPLQGMNQRLDWDQSLSHQSAVPARDVIEIKDDSYDKIAIPFVNRALRAEMYNDGRGLPARRDRLFFVKSRSTRKAIEEALEPHLWNPGSIEWVDDEFKSVTMRESILVKDWYYGLRGGMPKQMMQLRDNSNIGIARVRPKTMKERMGLDLDGARDHGLSWYVFYDEEPQPFNEGGSYPPRKWDNKVPFIFGIARLGDVRHTVGRLRLPGEVGSQARLDASILAWKKAGDLWSRKIDLD